MSPRVWSGRGWSVTVAHGGVIVDQATGRSTIPATDAKRLEVRRRWFRWHLHVDGRPLARLRGITAPDAAALTAALRWLELLPAVAVAVSWHATVSRHLERARSDQRWIPTEDVDALLANRPDPRVADQIRAVGAEPALDDAQRAALAFLTTDVEALVADTNEHITTAELSTRRPFFDTIEKSPLTGEQARAVVCFDNRVQVLAAAGSGKTSVMVARAAYAVARGFVAPDRILLLAFNKAAAAELQDRITARFAAAGIDASGVRASTFHAFGLEVIGRATGHKPRLAPWLDGGQDVAMVLRIVDELRDSSATFRYRWDLYRLLFATAPTDLDEDEPDGYDKETRETGYRTFGGEVVRSHSERLVANFLYLNGIDYRYERPYDVDVADATHSQYRPDFYYPAINVWHEHWALDRDGNPPQEFHGYAQGMAWKRRLHAQHGTTLVETTWAEVMFGDGLAKLETELTRLGLAFDWNPDRPLNDQWARPMKHEDLARFIRTFMAHVKSNSWTEQDLEARLGSDLPGLAGYRTRLFLDVYWPIHLEWQRRLTDDGSVDFEDMLVQAADHLEGGEIASPYELVLVDEFQDASRARARLIRGLVNAPGRYLLAVGDDWQSVNRFAGADLSVMTGFDGWFGRSRQLALTTTFRCTQTICDVARTFVTRNPAQLDKPMRSVHEHPGPPVTVIRSDDAKAALAGYLADLSKAIVDGRTPADPDGAVTVDVLGRYRFERDVLPTRTPANLQVAFRTVHSAKGLEADYVVVPGVATGTYGFPSSITDDPVLALAMPEPDGFPHAEERRLLYVALTRARRAVALFTPPQRPSPFVAELLDHPQVTVPGDNGTAPEVCPRCRRGTMVERDGPRGRFLGCSAFPRCKNTRNLR